MSNFDKENLFVYPSYFEKIDEDVRKAGVRLSTEKFIRYGTDEYLFLRRKKGFDIPGLEATYVRLVEDFLFYYIPPEKSDGFYPDFGLIIGGNGDEDFTITGAEFAPKSLIEAESLSKKLYSLYDEIGNSFLREYREGGKADSESEELPVFEKTLNEFVKRVEAEYPLSYNRGSREILRFSDTNGSVTLRRENDKDGEYFAYSVSYFYRKGSDYLRISELEEAEGSYETYSDSLSAYREAVKAFIDYASKA